MELSDLRHALRRHRLVALAVFGLCVALGVAAAVLPAKTYEAEAVVLVLPVGGSETSAANFIAPSYVELLTSQTNRAQAGSHVRPSERDARISASAEHDPGTGVLRLKVQSSSPVAAAAWANALAEELIEDEAAAAEEYQDAVDAAEQQQLSEDAAVDAGLPPPDTEPIDIPPAPAPVTLRIAEPATVPSSPVAPKPLPIVVSAVALGLILAPLAALAANRRRSSRDIGSAIRTRLDVPVLAEIPRVRRLEHTSVVALLRGQDRSLVEAFQQLRTGLAIGAPMENEAAVVVTSIRRKAGRSTVAAGLSWAMAERSDTCLIDSDLRHPSAHTCVDEPFGPGLANSAQIDVADLVRPTAVPNLWLLPAGESDRHPADIALTILRRVLGDLAARFHSEVIDAPPLGLAETPLIVASTNCVVLVVDGPTTELDDVKAAVGELRSVGAAYVAVVVNRARRRKGGVVSKGYVAVSTNGAAAHEARWAHSTGSVVTTASYHPAPVPMDPQEPMTSQDEGAGKDPHSVSVPARPSGG